MRIMHKRARRVIAGSIIVLGGLLMWLAPDSFAGIVMLSAAVVLEAVGIALEQRKES